MFKWLSGLVDSNEREIKKVEPLVKRINDLEADFQNLSDAELKAKTEAFKKFIEESTAAERQKTVAMQSELSEAQSCQLDAPLEEREDIYRQCQDIQERIKDAEKDVRKAENRLLDEILPEAFAAVREASRQKLGLRHYDVQLVGGIVLHRGHIAEMRTGEGKTLVATLALYLNALTGRGVHLVTVNDYLARRDPYWMGPIFHTLGLSVASIYPMQSPEEHLPARLYDPDFDSEKEDDPWRHFKPIPRQEAYKADVTYGTSAEFGFDYLRDNMSQDLTQLVQRNLNYAIVDEVDNLLIDEARTPLIISGQAEDQSQLYTRVNSVVSRMKWKVLTDDNVTPGDEAASEELESQYDFIAYEKIRSVKATKQGQEKFARAMGYRSGELFGEDVESGSDIFSEEEQKKHKYIALFRQSMIANALFKKDVDYVLKDGEIVIVDEFTGRLMLGRRYSEGLHQAIEAKEGVKVQRESRTYATITIQNYFRMYEKLAGMTGTAETEAEEFSRIYKLEVVIIPTNKPIMREDMGDLIYKDEKSKVKALAQEIEDVNKTGRPILVGTVSIEKNRELSEMLDRRGIRHNVLNAKNHLKEAEVIARAGEEKAVTVATNMAGRGVDIILGGKPAENGDAKALQEWQKRHDRVVELGGLHVIGSERHEARRIDNQLRGRAGRQGDPGSSRFFVALDDDIMRKFGGERVQGIMNWAGMDENTPIENKLISRSIENAQVRVEGYHFDTRKHIVDYDDVINKQREVIYNERHKILAGADLRSNILDMMSREIGDIVDEAQETSRGEEPDFEGLIRNVSAIFPLPPDVNAASLRVMEPDDIKPMLIQLAQEQYARKEQEVPENGMRVIERLIMLRVMDTLWVEHLTAVDSLRQGIGLMSAGQRDPLVAYRSQASDMFQELMATIRADVVRSVFRVNIVKKEGSKEAPVKPIVSPMEQITGKPLPAGKTLPPVGHKPGRNDPCTCGSGKKFKHCCGK